MKYLARSLGVEGADTVDNFRVVQNEHLAASYYVIVYSIY